MDSMGTELCLATRAPSLNFQAEEKSQLERYQSLIEVARGAHLQTELLLKQAQLLLEQAKEATLSSSVRRQMVHELEADFVARDAITRLERCRSFLVLSQKTYTKPEQKATAFQPNSAAVDARSSGQLAGSNSDEGTHDFLELGLSPSGNHAPTLFPPRSAAPSVQLDAWAYSQASGYQGDEGALNRTFPGQLPRTQEGGGNGVPDATPYSPLRGQTGELPPDDAPEILVPQISFSSLPGALSPGSSAFGQLLAELTKGQSGGGRGQSPNEPYAPRLPEEVSGAAAQKATINSTSNSQSAALGPSQLFAEFLKVQQGRTASNLPAGSPNQLPFALSPGKFFAEMLQQGSRAQGQQPLDHSGRHLDQSEGGPAAQGAEQGFEIAIPVARNPAAITGSIFLPEGKSPGSLLEPPESSPGGGLAALLEGKSTVESFGGALAASPGHLSSSPGALFAELLRQSMPPSEQSGFEQPRGLSSLPAEAEAERASDSALRSQMPMGSERMAGLDGAGRSLPALQRTARFKPSAGSRGEDGGIKEGGLSLLGQFQEKLKQNAAAKLDSVAGARTEATAPAAMTPMEPAGGGGPRGGGKAFGKDGGAFRAGERLGAPPQSALLDGLPIDVSEEEEAEGSMNDQGAANGEGSPSSHQTHVGEKRAAEAMGGGGVGPPGGPKRVSKRPKMPKKVVLADAPEDGWQWRKYGQKDTLNSPFPRSYYRCALKVTEEKCPAKKQVERCRDDNSKVKITYTGEHNHAKPPPRTVMITVINEQRLPSSAPTSSSAWESSQGVVPAAQQNAPERQSTNPQQYHSNLSSNQSSHPSPPHQASHMHFSQLLLPAMAVRAKLEGGAGADPSGTGSLLSQQQKQQLSAFHSAGANFDSSIATHGGMGAFIQAASRHALAAQAEAEAQADVKLSSLQQGQQPLLQTQPSISFASSGNFSEQGPNAALKGSDSPGSAFSIWNTRGGGDSAPQASDVRPWPPTPHFGEAATLDLWPSPKESPSESAQTSAKDKPLFSPASNAARESDPQGDASGGWGSSPVDKPSPSTKETSQNDEGNVKEVASKKRVPGKHHGKGGESHPEPWSNREFSRLSSTEGKRPFRMRSTPDLPRSSSLDHPAGSEERLQQKFRQTFNTDGAAGSVSQEIITVARRPFRPLGSKLEGGKKPEGASPTFENLGSPLVSLSPLHTIKGRPMATDIGLGGLGGGGFESAGRVSSNANPNGPSPL